MCSHQSAPMKMVSEMPKTNWSNAAFYIMLFALYLCLNSVLNLANRWALGLSGFSFPILLTMAHAAFSFSVLGPILSARRVDHAATLRKSWRGIVLIGILMGCNIACNNLSLVHLPLSLNQVTRASLPVVTAAVAVLVEKKVPTRGECGALILLTMGVTVTVFEGKATGSGAGLMLCVAGVLCAAAMLSTAGLVLSEKMDVLQLTFYTAPVSCLMLFPFYLLREHQLFMVYVRTNQQSVMMIIVLSSCVALAYNITHNFLLQRTSAVTVTVLGEVKIVGLLLLSAMILPGESSQFTMKMTVGCVLAIAGFCMYSNAKIAAQRGLSATLPTTSAEGSAFSQEKFLELITADGAKQQDKHVLRGCSHVPLFNMLRNVTSRRGMTSSKLSKMPIRGTTYVVADSTLKDTDTTVDMRSPNRPPRPTHQHPGGSLQPSGSCEVTLHSGYENKNVVGGQLSHVNGKNGMGAKAGPPQGGRGFPGELGKVKSVPDVAILEIDPESMMSVIPQMAPKSYEALQNFDSAPRGYNLAQPV